MGTIEKEVKMSNPRFLRNVVMATVLVVVVFGVLVFFAAKTTPLAGGFPDLSQPKGVATPTLAPEAFCAQWFKIDPGLPPEKRALEEADYQECVKARQAGPASPTEIAEKFRRFFAGRTPEPTRLDDTIHKKAGAGTIVEYRSPRVPSYYISENYWYAEIGGKLIVVSPVVRRADIDGAELPRPWQGEVWVSVTTPDESKEFEGGIFPIPVKSGRIRIVDARGQRLAMQAENGMVFYFDVPTRQFVSSLDPTTPTVKPYP